MLQLDGVRSRFRENGVHKVRRYRKIDVASGPVSDVTVIILDIAHIARTNNKPIRLRRISAFLPPQQAGGYPAEDSYEKLKSGRKSEAKSNGLKDKRR